MFTNATCIPIITYQNCNHCKSSPLLFDKRSFHVEVKISDMTTPATLDESELDEIYSFATQLAKRAGQMLLDAVDARSGQTGGASHVEKESAVDLVTQTDEGESFSRLTSQASGCNLFPASYLYCSLTTGCAPR